MERYIIKEIKTNGWSRYSDLYEIHDTATGNCLMQEYDKELVENELLKLNKGSFKNRFLDFLKDGKNER